MCSAWVMTEWLVVGRLLAADVGAKNCSVLGDFAPDEHM